MGNHVVMTFTGMHVFKLVSFVDNECLVSGTECDGATFMSLPIVNCNAEEVRC